MAVYLTNPSDVSFGTANYSSLAVCARWCDSESLRRLWWARHCNLRPYQRSGWRCSGHRDPHRQRSARQRDWQDGTGTWSARGLRRNSRNPVSREALGLGGAHSVVEGDGDVVWPSVLADCCNGVPRSKYLGGRIEASDFVPARWDLIPPNRYM